MHRISRRFAHPKTNAPSPRRRQATGAGLMLLYGLIYGGVGFLLTALPAVPWWWPVALVAMGVHIWVISRSTPLTPTRRWLSPLSTDGLQILTALGLTLALTVAMNYLGSDQLNDITVGGTALQVVVFSLMAVGVALACRWVTHHLSHRLLGHLSHRQTRGILGGIGLIGMTLGGALGFFA